MARLIVFFLIFAVFLIFIVLNLDNKCNLNLGFHTFMDVPIYITSFFSIFVGMVVSIPIFAFLRKKKGDRHPKPPPQQSAPVPEEQEIIPGENGPYGIN